MKCSQDLVERENFAFEHYVTPDIVCCGKGMGSGMPLSGVITSSKLINLPNA